IVLLECMRYGNKIVYARIHVPCTRGVNVLTAIECAA
ncbi:MAG: hypothetical protein QOJ51_4683, partial [Acidobacteriaceae bacterium]|nr:hypothetical protein [Acidobacteriaceae bacterium]